jgi:hypothetical protein
MNDQEGRQNINSVDGVMESNTTEDSIDLGGAKARPIKLYMVCKCQ